MAREVAGDQALVAGAVTSAIGFDRSLASLEESYADCREESDLLIDLGVDFLILEGFWFLDEARTALKAAVEAVGSKDKAVLVTLPFRFQGPRTGTTRIRAAECFWMKEPISSGVTPRGTRRRCRKLHISNFTLQIEGQQL